MDDAEAMGVDVEKSTVMVSMMEDKVVRIDDDMGYRGERGLVEG